MIGNKINILTLHDLLRVELGNPGRADGHLVGVEVIEVSLAIDADYENEEQEKRTHPRSHLFHRNNWNVTKIYINDNIVNKFGTFSYNGK